MEGHSWRRGSSHFSARTLSDRARAPSELCPRWWGTHPLLRAASLSPPGAAWRLPEPADVAGCSWVTRNKIWDPLQWPTQRRAWVVLLLLGTESCIFCTKTCMDYPAHVREWQYVALRPSSPLAQVWLRMDASWHGLWTHCRSGSFASISGSIALSGRVYDRGAVLDERWMSSSRSSNYDNRGRWRSCVNSFPGRACCRDIHMVVLRKTLNSLANFSAVCYRELRDPLYHVALLYTVSGSCGCPHVYWRTSVP